MRWTIPCFCLLFFFHKLLTQTEDYKQWGMPRNEASSSLHVCSHYLPTVIPSVESVVFCKMAPLQLTLYQHLLRSGLVQACLRRSSNFSPHLVCIGALKKLCNCPSLIHSASAQVKESERGSENIEEVRVYEGVPIAYKLSS